MLRDSIIIIFVLIGAATGVFAQKAETNGADEAAIRQIVNQLETGWTKGDGKAFAAPFAEDADYVVINGNHIKGREAVAAEHQYIFDSIFKGTALKLEIRKVRLLRPDVAIVHLQGDVLKKDEVAPKIPAALPTLVLSREDGGWQIVAFQNTPNRSAQADRK